MSRDNNKISLKLVIAGPYSKTLCNGIKNIDRNDKRVNICSGVAFCVQVRTKFESNLEN